MPADPSIVLLLGDPVSRSLSPGMQNAAFATLGIDCAYVPQEVNAGGLAGAMAELRANERILGANVTIPHKESVIAYLDDLDPQAARIGIRVLRTPRQTSQNRSARDRSRTRDFQGKPSAPT